MVSFMDAVKGSDLAAFGNKYPSEVICVCGHNPLHVFCVDTI